MALPAEKAPDEPRISVSQSSVSQISVSEYLVLDEESEMRHEYVDGVVVAMSGGSRRHAAIAMNLGLSLAPQLRRGGRCRPYSTSLRLRVDADLYTYPDFVVSCEEERYAESGELTLLDATLIVEVLSPSTESIDRGVKWTRYRELPSLRDYLLVSQDRVRVERYSRRDDGTWVFSETTDPAAVLDLPAIGAQLALAEVYEGVIEGTDPRPREHRQ